MYHKGLIDAVTLNKMVSKQMELDGAKAKKDEEKQKKASVATFEGRLAIQKEREKEKVNREK